jgi:hypothetical protein
VSATSPHPTDALISLVYGELSGAEAARVQVHLDGCAACAATVDAYRAVRQAATALPREIASDKGLDSLLHYGAQAAARARRRRAVRWTGSLLGAAVAAGLVLFLAFPRSPPGARVASTPVPPALGPLAQNEVRPLAKAPPQELPEAAASLRRVPSAPPAPPSSAKATVARAKQTDQPRRMDEEATAEARDALASRETAGGAVARVQPPLAASKRAEVAAEARGAGAAGAPAQRTAPAAFASAPSALDVSPASVALKPTLLDAGAAQQLLDERRRGTLLQQLAGAKGAQALPILSELCALEARLGRRSEAEKTCLQVVQGYPGTPEASAAQRVLDALPAP